MTLLEGYKHHENKKKINLDVFYILKDQFVLLSWLQQLKIILLFELLMCSLMICELQSHPNITFVYPKFVKFPFKHWAKM